jgi:hypothetical protein
VFLPALHGTEAADRANLGILAQMKRPPDGGGLFQNLISPMVMMSPTVMMTSTTVMAPTVHLDD